MKINRTLRAGSLVVAAILSSLPATASAAKILTVVTTTSDLASIAKSIGGDRVEASSIALGTQDPHFIEAKPSYMIRLRNADLFVKIGLELEVGYEALLLNGSRNDKIRPGARGYLDASADVAKLEIPAGTIDRTMGDVHAFGNPHYWLDPFNVRIMARAMAARLIELAPENKPVYEAGLTRFIDKLDRAMFGDAAVGALGGEKSWALARSAGLEKALADAKLKAGGWHAQMAPYRGSNVISYHKSWSYLLNRFGLTSVGEMEPRPGIPPSPAHLLDLIHTGQREKVRFIISEPFHNINSAQFVASKVGIPVLSLPQSVGGAAQAADTISLMDYLVNSMSAAMAGKK